MFKLRIALIALLVLLLMIVPVYAQDTTPEATGTAEMSAAVSVTLEAAPPETRPIAGVAEDTTQVPANGATALVLLVGIVAIGAVAGGALIRATYQPPKE